MFDVHTHFWSWPGNTSIYLFDFSFAIIHSKKDKLVILISYLNIDNLIKRSKGKRNKSAPAQMLALGPSPFPQATGANTEGSSQHSQGMILQMGQRNQGLTFISLYLHHSREVPILAGLFCTHSIRYQLLALLPRAISSPKIWVTLQSEHVSSPILEKTLSNGNVDWIQASTTAWPLLYIYSPEGQLKSAFLHPATSTPLAFALPLGRKGGRQRAGPEVYLSLQK